MVLGAHLHGSRKRGKECKYLVLIGLESQFSIFSMSSVFSSTSSVSFIFSNSQFHSV